MVAKAIYSSSNEGTLRSRLLHRDGTRRSKQKALSRAAGVQASRRNDLMPNLQLVDIAVEKVTAPTRNVRSLAPSHIREVANAIAELGFAHPILVNGEREVIDGVVRLEAAKLLNLPVVPCIIVDSLTKKQLKLLRLSINRLGEKNTWNLDDLRLELTELIVDKAPIEVSGFDLIEIDGILTEVEPDQVEPGTIEPKAKVAVARLGDVFRLGDHRVVCGDATDPSVMYLAMRGERARMVFTDQPYNVPIAGNVTKGDHREFEMASGEMSDDEFLAFNDAWIGEAIPHLVDGGILATFIDWRGLTFVTMAALSAQLSQLNLLVWAKTNAGMGSLYRSQHELIPLFKKGDAPHVNNVKLGTKGRWRSNVITHAGASSMRSDARRGLQHHPTVKPVVMLSDIMLDLTNRGDIVLDPFLGSGSTLIAAEKSGRICMGVEIDPLYVDLICRRFAEVTGKVALLEETSETFAALQERRALSRPPSLVSPAISPAPAAVDEAVVTGTAPVYRKRTRLPVSSA